MRSAGNDGRVNLDPRWFALTANVLHAATAVRKRRRRRGHRAGGAAPGRVVDRGGGRGGGGGALSIPFMRV